MGCCAELVPGIKLADASCPCLWASSHGFWIEGLFSLDVFHIFKPPSQSISDLKLDGTFSWSFFHLQVSFTIHLWFETWWPGDSCIFFSFRNSICENPWNPAWIWYKSLRNCCKGDSGIFFCFFLLLHNPFLISKLDGLELASCISFFSLTNPVIVRTLET